MVGVSAVVALLSARRYLAILVDICAKGGCGSVECRGWCGYGNRVI